MASLWLILAVCSIWCADSFASGYSGDSNPFVNQFRTESQGLETESPETPLIIFTTTRPLTTTSKSTSRSPSLPVIQGNEEIQWMRDNWAFGCDFPGNSLSSKQIRGEQCGGTCGSTRGCTHFTWTRFNGGTCFLKQGNINKSKAVVVDDKNKVCGIIVETPTEGVDWGRGNWAFGCDFPGNSLSSKQIPGEQCGGTCAATTGCTHFTWTSFQGGTCLLKRGSIRKSDAIFSDDASAVCGVMD